MDFRQIYTKSKLEESRLVTLINDNYHKLELLNDVIDRLHAPNVEVVRRAGNKIERFGEMITDDDYYGEWSDKDIIDFFKNNIKINNMHVCAYDKNEEDYIYIFSLNIGDKHMYSKVYINWDEDISGKAYILSFHNQRGKMFDDMFMSEDRPNKDFFKNFWLDNVEKNIRNKTEEHYEFKYDGYQDFTIRVNNIYKPLTDEDVKRIARVILSNEFFDVRCIKLQLIAKYKSAIKFRVIFNKPNYLPAGEDENTYSKTEFFYKKR